MTTVLEDIEADLAIVYDADFGFVESVTGPGGAILGVFDNAYFLAEGATIGVRSTTPALRTRDADAMAEGAPVTIRSNDYTVTEPQPDGFGETIHLLRRV
jgi:hypothetical protein